MQNFFLYISWRQNSPLSTHLGFPTRTYGRHWGSGRLWRIVIQTRIDTDRCAVIGDVFIEFGIVVFIGNGVFGRLIDDLSKFLFIFVELSCGLVSFFSIGYLLIGFFFLIGSLIESIFSLA